jgi:hypothetical protein
LFPQKKKAPLRGPVFGAILRLMRRTLSSFLALALAFSGAALLIFLTGHKLPTWNGQMFAAAGLMAGVGSVWLFCEITGAE